jgi:hypothetical protein
LKLQPYSFFSRSNARTRPSLTERDAKKLRLAAVKQQRERAAQKAQQEEVRRHSFAEQQVAMALAHLPSGSRSPLNLGISGIDNLIGTLIQEAPQDVQGLFTQEETLSEDQKTFLRAAKEQIERLLARSS